MLVLRHTIDVEIAELNLSSLNLKNLKIIKVDKETNDTCTRSDVIKKSPFVIHKKGTTNKWKIIGLQDLSVNNSYNVPEIEPEFQYGSSILNDASNQPIASETGIWELLKCQKKENIIGMQMKIR